LADYKTNVIYVPPGTTSLVQPIDVIFNTPFKAAVERQATVHLQENLSQYVNGTICVSERRVLFTKKIRAAWEEVSANKDMIIH
jgi:hypothetical protein